MRTWVCLENAEHTFYTLWPDALEDDGASCPWCSARCRSMTQPPTSATRASSSFTIQAQPLRLT